MEEKAERLARIVLTFGIQPSEARKLTGYEIEALFAVGREMNGN